MSPRKGGALNPHKIGPSRHAIALAAMATMLGLPLVLLGGAAAHATGGGRSDAAAPAPRVAHGPRALAQVQTLRHLQLTDNRISPRATPVTTTSTTSPAVAVSTPSAPPVVRAAPTTVSRPVAVAPATTTTTAAPVSMSHATGLATWYAWNPGQCASPILPKGTWVTVTNDATGARTSCEVTDREANNPGRVIDLDTAVFAQIAPLSSGAVTVTISW